MGLSNAQPRRLHLDLTLAVRGALAVVASLGLSASAPELSSADRSASDPVGKPGNACGVVEAVFPPNETTIAARVVAENGEVACRDARAIVHGFLASGPYETSAGRYHRDLGVWQCLTQTAGFYPEVARCDNSADGRRVLGLDAGGTRAADASHSCATDPSAEPRGPFGIEANISCRAAQRVARGEMPDGFGRLGVCNRRRCSRFALGFACESLRAPDPRGSATTCRLGDALVRFASRESPDALPFTGGNEPALATVAVALLLAGLAGRVLLRSRSVV